MWGNILFKMKIGFDAKRAVCNNTGLGNYSRLVIDVLSLYFPKNDYRLYSPVDRKNDRLEPLLSRENVEMVFPDTAMGRKLSSLWRVGSVSSQLCRDNVDLFHGLSNELPLSIAKSGIPSVVTIHDLIFRHFPQYYKPIDRTIYDYKFRKAAENASRVIAISECTRNDIVEMYGIDPKKIDVVYQGCDPLFQVPVTLEARQRVKEKYNLPERFIVAVGTVESRKNQLLAVKALRGLPDDVKLVIVGRRTAYATEIDNYIASQRGLASRVMFLEGVPFIDLPVIYALAQVSSYTSRFEGFGIPVIEALSVGTPVIAATGSCLEEAGGKGGVYVDPDNVDQYIEEARVLLDSRYHCDKLVELGRRHIKKFNLDNFAKGIMTTYNKAILGLILD